MIIPGTLSDPVYVGALAAYDAYHRLRYTHGYGKRPLKRPDQTREFKRFLEIGQTCLDNSWIPDEYVDFVFHSSRSPAQLTPKALASDASARRYRSYAGGSGTAAAEWSANEQLLFSVMGPGQRFRDPEQALLDLQMPFSDWFRVLLPWPPSEALYRVFGASVYENLRHSPGLRRDLANKLCPAQFAELQRRLGNFPEAYA